MAESGQRSVDDKLDGRGWTQGEELSGERFSSKQRAL